MGSRGSLVALLMCCISFTASWLFFADEGSVGGIVPWHIIQLAGGQWHSMVPSSKQGSTLALEPAAPSAKQ